MPHESDDKPLNVPTDEEWLRLRDPLVKEFGEDYAQTALLRFREVISRGGSVAFPLAWCREVARNARAYDKRKQGDTEMLSLDQLMDESSTADIDKNEWLIDERDPAILVEARETLALADGLLIDMAVNEDRRGESKTNAELLKRSRLRKQLREVLET